MITNGDPEGRDFLSHPHTNNGLFSLLTIKYLMLKMLPEVPEFPNLCSISYIYYRLHIQLFNVFNDLMH